MKKNIWIFNHYATKMYENQGGRHYWFAENLLKEGAKPVIFCASTYHNSNKIIETHNKKYIVNEVNNIPFVFVRTSEYKGNGIDRVKNMISFYKNIFTATREYAKKNGKPDIILASSVHPLTLVAGIKIAKKFSIPCVCEVRDLWPETLVSYNIVHKNNPILKLLYAGEKLIYKKANQLIFTMEGGKDYIIEQKWDIGQGGPIDLKKVHHINNGINLESFHFNKENYLLEDEDLNNNETFKVIYTGSIRPVNNVKIIVDAAHIISDMGVNHIKFLIYGDGSEREYLEKYCIENKIDNVVFKGFVDKKNIPYILSRSNLNIMHFNQNRIKKFGASLNKMFEYFASGKPTLSDCEFGYDLIKRYNCGIVVDKANENELARAIIQCSNLSNNDYEEYCENAKKAAEDFDFKILTQKLVKVLDKAIEKDRDY